MEVIPTPKDIPPISTSDFEFGTYGFDEFNYLQSLAYPYHDQDCNLVVSAATSSGKTICGELFMGPVLAEDKKVILLSPLKALTQQIFQDWSGDDHWLSNHKIAILTGDQRTEKQKLQEAEVIVMTSEMLDTKTRFGQSNHWLTEVGLVIVDEAHLMTTNRGPALEVGLMRFASMNPDAKLVLLSATMSNYLQVGEWVEELNGKPTHVLASDWRPVDLHLHSIRSRQMTSATIELAQALTCSSADLAPDLVSKDAQVRAIAENRVRGGIDNTKTLIFVHTKSLGRTLERSLTDLGLQAEFHNADLTKASRNKLEKKFKNELDILIATSTLAWGLNLPSRNCIVVGDKRGVETVESLELAQMCGRAGRFGMYDRGDAYLINCSVDPNFKIESQLKKVLAFHIVAEISNKTFDTMAGAVLWLKKSFFFATASHISHPNGSGQKQLSGTHIAGCFRNLVEWECIKEKSPGVYEVTPLGRIARDLYLDPQDIYTWQENFKKVEEKDLWDNPAALTWAIASDMKTCSMSYVPQQLKPLTREFRGTFGTHLKVTNEAIIAVLFYRLIRENYDSYMHRNLDVATAPYLQLFLRDSGRIFSALERISTLNRWDRESDMVVLKARIVHGVGEELVELVAIPGVGGTIATQLYKAGFRNLADVIAQKEQLGEYISRKANVTRILNGLKELEDA